MIMNFMQAWQMLKEVWELYKSYAIQKLDEQELNQFTKMANEIYKKYKTPFAKDIVLAVIGEVERSVKYYEEK